MAKALENDSKLARAQDFWLILDTADNDDMQFRNEDTSVILVQKYNAIANADRRVPTTLKVSESLALTARMRI